MPKQSCIFFVHIKKLIVCSYPIRFHTNVGYPHMPFTYDQFLKKISQHKINGKVQTDWHAASPWNSFLRARSLYNSWKSLKHVILDTFTTEPNTWMMLEMGEKTYFTASSRKGPLASPIQGMVSAGNLLLWGAVTAPTVQCKDNVGNSLAR